MEEPISVRILIVLGQVCGEMSPKAVRAFQDLADELKNQEE